MKIFYFGCYRECGHYMFAPGLSENWKFIRTNPWGVSVDGGLCPTKCGEYQPQGKALIHHKDGWTALSFWDRSVDHRGNSNSNFLAEGTFTFEQMVALAKEYFSTIWERYKFEVVDYGYGTVPSDR